MSNEYFCKHQLIPPKKGRYGCLKKSNYFNQLFCEFEESDFAKKNCRKGYEFIEVKNDSPSQRLPKVKKNFFKDLRDVQKPEDFSPWSTNFSQKK